MPAKKQTRAKKPNKRWMRAIGGYSSLKYLVVFIGGIGALAVTLTTLSALRPEPTIRQSLTGLTHTLDAPNPDEILLLVNNERKARKLPRLLTDARLTALAEARLADMINNQYYSHQNLSGKYYYDLFANHGFRANYSCENLGIESTLDAAKYVKGWMESEEGHKECLLHQKVKSIGVATGRFSKSTKNTDPSYLVVTIYTTTPESL